MVVTEPLIETAARALVDAASGTRVRVILFGSRARGQAAPDSDVDFLVVEEEVADRFAECARLARVAGELGVPADVVVVSETQVRDWGEVRGTMLHDALAEGRILAQA